MSSFDLLNQHVALCKTLEKKNLEIDKRKELVTKMADSEIVQKKQSIKDSQIERKIQSHHEELKRKREYYTNEIKKAEEKFEAYRLYCHQQMEMLEQKTDLVIRSLESQQETPTLSVSDDKILKRLEIEVQQLEEQKNEKYQKYLLLAKEEEDARLRDQRERVRMEEYNERMKKHYEHEMAMAAFQAKKEAAEREEEVRRQRKKEEREKEIQSIMSKHKCNYDQAQEMFIYRLANPVPVKSTEDIQRQNRNEAMKEIKKQYPQYKSVFNNLDVEYQNKLICLTGEHIVQFLETLKPQIELKLKFENDETLFFNDEYYDLYTDLTLDQQLECVKIKDKTKRHKYLDKFKKSRVQKINESHNCV